MLHNATWMLSAQSVQLVGRSLYFVIVAHSLGPAGYGAFVACTALVATMSPFAAFGTGHVLIKYVALDRNALPAYFGNAILVTAVSGSLLTLFALFIRPLVLPGSATAAMLLAVAISDLLVAQVTDICLNAFAALEKFRRYTQLMAWSTGVRLFAAIVLASSTATPLHWAYLYALSAVVAAVTGIAAVSLCCGMPRFRLNLIVASVREGFHFSSSEASQSVYNDIDKVMLARLSTVESVAIYAVAYRAVEAAMLPIRSMAAASYPEFFRQGKDGVTSAYSFARRLLRRSTVYGVAIALVLFVTAGLLPVIMGRAYAECAVALRYLCLLPVLKSVHSFLTDTLTGANYQWQRSSVQVTVAAFNVLINFWIIRAFSWRGAAWSSLMTDSLLAALLYIIIRWHLKREQTAREGTTAQTILAVSGE
jgi:O-antigen/teichoic acid export membrane protein